MRLAVLRQGGNFPICRRRAKLVLSSQHLLSLLNHQEQRTKRDYCRQLVGLNERVFDGSLSNITFLHESKNRPNVSYAYSKKVREHVCTLKFSHIGKKIHDMIGGLKRQFWRKIYFFFRGLPSFSLP